MDIARNLFKAQIPAAELITLDPVSLFPFGRVHASKWVNVYIKQSVVDHTFGNLPIVGTLLNAVITSPTLFTIKKGQVVVAMSQRQEASWERKMARTILCWMFRMLTPRPCMIKPGRKW